jgi:hypothetical protein
MMTDPIVFDPRAIEIAAFLANVFTVLGVIVAIVAGYLAYTNWKKQLIGTTKHELTRRVLKAVYTLRDAVNDFRSPVKSIPDKMEKLEDVPIEYRDGIVQFARLAEYATNPYPEEEIAELEKRWLRVLEALPAVEDLRIETEVLFDENVSVALMLIHSFPLKLYNNKYLDYIEILRKFKGKHYDDWNSEDVEKMWGIYEEIFMKWWKDTENDYLHKWIGTLEDELKEHLPKG